MTGLTQWMKGKPAANGLTTKKVSALIISVFGGWLFYLSQMNQGATINPLDRETMIDEWATLWASRLDTAP